MTRRANRPEDDPALAPALADLRAKLAAIGQRMQAHDDLIRTEQRQAQGHDWHRLGREADAYCTAAYNLQTAAKCIDDVAALMGIALPREPEAAEHAA